MKNSQVLSALVAGALAVGLTVTGSTGALAAPAIVCAPETSLDVTRAFYDPPVLEDDHATYFADDLVSYGTQQIGGAIGEVDALFGGHNAVPPATAAFFETRLPQIYDTFAQAGRVYVQRADSAGYTDAVAMRDLLSATYAFEFDVTNEFIAAYNADRVWEILDPQSPGRAHQYLLDLVSALVTSVPQAGTFSSYQQITNDFESTVDMSQTYAALFDAYTQAGLGAAEAEERTYVSMRNSVAAWIERIDIDYITAYQMQVRQYLSMSQSMGLVYDEQDQRAVLDVGQAGTRPLILADLGEDAVHGFGLYGMFFEMTINADGTDFLTPQDVYESADFQDMVTSVMTDLETLTDYSAASVTDSVEAALSLQYRAMSVPGSSMQPITVALPTYLRDYFDMYADSLTDASRGGMTLISDWRDEAIVPGETPYDTYRAKNYIDVPFTVLAKGGKHEVTREISYHFEDGVEAAPTETQRAEFTCLQDAFTDEVEWAPAGQEVTLPAPNVPSVTYPDGSATVLPPVNPVSPLLVHPDDKNSAVDVTFPLEFSVSVRYIDENGDPLRDSETLVGRWNTPFTAKAPAIDGYQVRAGATTVEGVFGTNTDPVVFVYALQGDGAVDPVTPKPVHPGTEKPQGLANTGAPVPLTIGLGAVLLLVAGAGAVLVGRRRI